MLLAAEGERYLYALLAEAGTLTASQVSQAKIPRLGIKLRKQKASLPGFVNGAGGRYASQR